MSTRPCDSFTPKTPISIDLFQLLIAMSTANIEFRLVWKCDQSQHMESSVPAANEHMAAYLHVPEVGHSPNSTEEQHMSTVQSSSLIGAVNVQI